MNNIIYNVCKRTILRESYPEDMNTRLEVFFENNLISKDEYNELINLMEVK